MDGEGVGSSRLPHRSRVPPPRVTQDESRGAHSFAFGGRCRPGSPPRCGDGQGLQNTEVEQAAAPRAGRRGPGRRDLVSGNEDGVQGKPVARVSLVTIAGQWLRLGCIGFGGPPTHISLLRAMCVQERAWIDTKEFEDAIATTNLLPGPASTQLAIYCAWRLRGAAGAVLGGLCFIVPGLVLILTLSSVFLASHPPSWVLGAAVPAVALNAASGLVPASWKRIGTGRARQARWVLYAVLGAAAAATVGAYLVVVLLACGLAAIVVRRRGRPISSSSARAVIPAVVLHAAAVGGLGALAWVAFKVGALSYGGGFVVIPLMQHDAVATYHWMTGAQFLSAVALGQVTPGPVVQTVAVVGYAAAGVGGALIAALVAFSPSFAFILVGGQRFALIRR